MAHLASHPSAAHAGIALRPVLVAEAVVSAACGVLMAAAAEPLAGLLGLPAALLGPAGLVLLPWSLLLVWLARRPVPSAGWVRAVIAVNLLWALDCALVLAAGWFQPTGLGVVFLLVQIVAVLVFAGLQQHGLRRRPRP